MPLYARLELWTIVAYVAVILVVGAYFSRRVRGGADFFAGGRRIPWWLSGVSLYMGNFSAWMFTGGAGLIYRTTGFGLLYFFLITTCAYVLGAWLTAALWRRSRVVSPVEMVRDRFGTGTQLLLAAIFAVMYLANAGSQLLALARIVEGVLGVEVVAAALVIGALIMLYTMAGGVWTVVVTDFVQCVILLAMVVVVVPGAVGLVDGGLGALWAEVELRVPPVDGAPEHTWAFLVAGILSYGLGAASVGSPRYYCVPDERDARRAGVLAGLLFLTTPLLFSVPALAGRVVFGEPGQLATLGWGKHPHELVFLEIVELVFSPGLVGLFVAAMFAASMSALDSVINVVAAVLSRDVWPHLRPVASERQGLRVGRAMTFLCGAVVTSLAVVYHYGPADLFVIMTTVAFLSAPPLYVPMVLGLLYRKAPPAAGLMAGVWGLCMGGVTKLALGWQTGPQVLVTLLTTSLLFLATPALARVPRTFVGLGVLWIAVTAAFVNGLASLPGGGGAAGWVGSLFGALAVLTALACRASQPSAATHDLWQRLDRPIAAQEVEDADTTAAELLGLVARLCWWMAAGVVAMGVFEAATASAPLGDYAAVAALMALAGTACARVRGGAVA